MTDATTSVQRCVPRPASLLVIGVGNRDRGDDGIGPLVVEAVRARCDATVATHIAEGDLSDLAIRWRSDQDVIIVDAVLGGAVPGRVVEIDALTKRLPTDAGLLSSHGVGLAEAVELARLLGRLPRSLTILGVETTTFEQFDPVSTQVADAVSPLVDRIAHCASQFRASDESGGERFARKLTAVRQASEKSRRGPILRC